MPFANLNSLRAWLPENHYFFNEETPESLTEAFKQVDNIIKSYTGESAPANVADADPLYTSIACRLVLYMTSGNDVPDSEMQRRRILYEQAYNELKENRADPDKDKTTNAEPGFYSQDKRVELL